MKLLRGIVGVILVALGFLDVTRPHIHANAYHPPVVETIHAAYQNSNTFECRDIKLPPMG